MDALTAFGMKAEDAIEFTDVLAATANGSNTSVSMLGESFKYVAPLAGSLGISAQDTSFALGLMANAGIKGSQAGTTLKTALVNLAKPSKQMKIEMDKLGISLTDGNGKVKEGKVLYDELREKFNKLTPAQKASSAATIFGKESMAGMLSVINASDEDYNKLYNNLEHSAGSTQKMADIMQNTAEGAITSMKSALEGAGIALFESLEPHIVRVAKRIGELAGWFTNLNPKVMNTIVVVGALAAGIGPLIWGFAKVTGILSTAFTAISTISGAFAILSPVVAGSAASALVATPAMTALAGAFTFLMGPVGLAILGFGLVAGALGFVVNDLRKEAIPEINRFGEGVSDATKKSVGAFLDLEEKASVSLKQLAWSGQTVTKETADTIVSSFEGMSSQVVQEFNTQKDESILALKDMFLNTTNMTEEEKKKIIDVTTKKFNDNIDIVNSGNARIKEITSLALVENRELTKKEFEEINSIKKTMTDTAIQILSKGEKEQLAIMESLKAESGKISALQAAEVVQNSKKQRDDTVKEANQSYNDLMKVAGELRADGTAVSAKAADEIVTEAKRQRKDAVAEANKMHLAVVDEAKLQAKEHVDSVNWETGEVLSRWSKMVVDLKAIVSGADKWMTEKITGFVEWSKNKWAESGKSTSGSWNFTSEDAKRIWGNIVSTLGLSQGQISKNQKAEGERQRTQSRENMLAMLQDTIKWLGDKHTQLSNWWSRTNKTNSDNNLRERNATLNNVREMHNDAMFWASQKLSGLVGWWNKQREARREQDRINKRESAENWSRIKDDAILKSKQAYEGIAKWWGKVVGVVAIPANKVIDGANWVLGKLGASTKIKHWSYAKGTDGHPGGDAMVNDEKGTNYREAIQFSNGETIIPKGRNVVIPNMPVGTKVLPAMETKNMYRYAKGTGVWSEAKNVGSKAIKKAFDIFSYFTKPLELAKKAIADHVSYGGATGITLDMSKGLVGKATTQMGEFIKGKFTSDFGGGSGSGLGGAGTSPVFSGGRGFPGLVRTSPFGWRTHPISGKRKMHNGVDMAGGQRFGHPIYAQAPGTVFQAGGTSGGYGNVVRTRIGNLVHLYAHLQSAVARVGQVVKPGQLVGKMGSSGASTGPHVHYEVRRNGQAIHPGYKNGRLVTKEHTATVGEGNKPELIIPLTNRERAMELISQAKRFMGVREDIGSSISSLSSISSSTSTRDNINGVNEELLAEAIVQGLKREGLSKPANITLDGRSVGKGMVKILDTQLKGSSDEDLIGKGVLAW